MSDNVTIRDGNGGLVGIATEQVGGAQVPVTKVGFGERDSYQGVDPTHGLPVTVVGSTAHSDAAAIVAALAPLSATLPVTAAIAGPLPPGANTLGGVVAQLASSVLYDAGVAATPMFAAINSGALGVNTIVAAVAGRRIRVLSYVLIGAGSATATFQSGGGTPLTGPLPLAAQSGVSAGFSPVGHFQSAPGESIALLLSAATAVAGHLAYLVAAP